MSLQDQDKLTRRSFIAGLLATGVAKGLALPPGVEEAATGWVNETTYVASKPEWEFVYRLVIQADTSATEQGWQDAWDSLAQTG